MLLCSNYSVNLFKPAFLQESDNLYRWADSHTSGGSKQKCRLRFLTLVIPWIFVQTCSGKRSNLLFPGKFPAWLQPRWSRPWKVAFEEISFSPVFTFDKYDSGSPTFLVWASGWCKCGSKMRERGKNLDEEKHQPGFWQYHKIKTFL